MRFELIVILVFLEVFSRADATTIKRPIKKQAHTNRVKESSLRKKIP